ncbi:MAG: phosphatase PAP2 family protein [Ignavibacteriaceae bacterium]
MKKINTLLFALLFLIQPFAHAQIITNAKNDVLQVLNMGGDLATSFTTFNETKAWDLAGTVAAIGIGYSVDYNLHSFSQRNVTPLDSKIFSIDNIYGSGYTLYGIAGIYGYGLFFNNPGVRKIGVQTIEAVGYAGVITSVLKSLIGRSRPYTYKDKADFHPFNTHAAETSFPSGHMTVAVAMSTVLANNTNNIFLKILCYSAAGLVGCSRIYHNAHWFSDVIAGGAIGYFVGNFVTNNYENNSKNNSGLSFHYSVNSLGITYSF